MALLTPTFYTAKSTVSGTTLVSDTEIPADAGDLIIVSVANNAAANKIVRKWLTMGTDHGKLLTNHRIYLNKDKR